MIDKSWKYVFQGNDGKPLRGTVLAATKEEAENRLVSMGIPGASLDSGEKGEDAPVVTTREALPVLVANPIRVLDQISKSAQAMAGSVGQRNETEISLDLGNDIGKKKGESASGTRERILFGEPEKVLPVAEKFLSEMNGTVRHFGTVVDSKGRLLVAVVIRHEEDENEKA